MSELVAQILAALVKAKSSASSGIIVVLLAVAAFVGFKFYSLNNQLEAQAKQITNLTLDNKVLTENNKVLKQNQNVVVDANQTNYETAKKLDEERAASKATIAALAVENSKSKEALDILRKTVAALAKDPKNDGPVAEVLRETVRQIQANRDSK